MFYSAGTPDGRGDRLDRLVRATACGGGDVRDALHAKEVENIGQKCSEQAMGSDLGVRLTVATPPSGYDAVAVLHSERALPSECV